MTEGNLNRDEEREAERGWMGEGDREDQNVHLEVEKGFIERKGRQKREIT